MPELRRDPITGRWVIISTERGKRPLDFIRESVPIRELPPVRSAPAMKARRLLKFSPTAATVRARTRRAGPSALSRISFRLWELKVAWIARARDYSIA